jgi:hypothetical protein
MFAVTHLESTLVKCPRTVDSKRLKKILRALESTVTKNRGEGYQSRVAT